MYKKINKNSSGEVFCLKIFKWNTSSLKHAAAGNSPQLFLYFHVNSPLPSRSSLVRSTAACSPSGDQTKTGPGRRHFPQAGRCHPQSRGKPVNKCSHHLNQGLYSNSRCSEIKNENAVHLRKARLHIKLLEHGVHVTRGSTVLQSYEAWDRPALHRW